MGHPRACARGCTLIEQRERQLPADAKTSTAIYRIRAAPCERDIRRAHARARRDPRTLARRGQRWSGRRRKLARARVGVRWRDRPRVLARRVVRCVRCAGWCAAYGRAGPVHRARGAAGRERVRILDGTLGVCVVWRGHVWRAHDSV